MTCWLQQVPDSCVQSESGEQPADEGDVEPGRGRLGGGHNPARRGRDLRVRRCLRGPADLRTSPVYLSSSVSASASAEVAARVKRSSRTSATLCQDR